MLGLSCKQTCLKSLIGFKNWLLLWVETSLHPFTVDRVSSQQWIPHSIPFSKCLVSLQTVFQTSSAQITLVKIPCFFSFLLCLLWALKEHKITAESGLFLCGNFSYIWSTVCSLGLPDARKTRTERSKSWRDLPRWSAWHWLQGEAEELTLSLSGVQSV